MTGTAAGLSQWIGWTVHVMTGVGNIKVTCIVYDVKMAWGKIRFFVKPIMGTGEAWVEDRAIKFVSKGK